MKRLLYILTFLLLVLLVHASAGVPTALYPQHGRTTVVPQDTAKQDTTPVRRRQQARRARNSQRRNYKNPMDSIRQAVAAQALGDTLQEQLAGPDTLAAATLPADSLSLDSVPKKNSGLDSPVSYAAKDSVWYFMDSGNIYMYGSGEVKYQNMELNSELITVNLDSTIVRAHGVVDSTGVLQGKPVFKEGGTEYQSEQMSYNFKSKKGYIVNVDTQQEDGYLKSQRSMKDSEDNMFLEHGTYTTCDDEHPHFYIALSRAKVKPKKSVFFGPAWLVVEDVPLPFAIPFGFFPFTSSNYSSGFIMPSYGDEMSRGFYLRDGGYYFAISDRMDLKLTGEIYTKGSWGLSASSTYNKRYRYRGNFGVDYQVYKTGEKNYPDYSETKSFRIQWSHSQDSKASPNSTFSANVNYSTSAYDKTSMSSLYNPTQYAQSTKTSSISYSRTFSDIGLTLSTSANVSMSTRDSSINMTLPDLNISLARFNPFKRKHAAGKERWYEKIALSYTGNLSNSIMTKENQLLHSNLVKDWKNGFRHNIPVSASFTILKYINITPAFNYTERWYTQKEGRSWDREQGIEVRDTTYGFNRVYNWNLAVSANTKIYGFYKPWKMFGDKINMIRHVITPTISYSYAPDFSASRYGYYDTYLKTDANGQVTSVTYSPYSSGLYGVPG
ncbi:MAG: putative LPS assembly protein LptD, partial [Bacteroidales bacterium]|nr:putative LPS assembly protein LptD [Bacteroidales bacterium]